MAPHIYIVFNPKQYVQADLKICHMYVNIAFIMNEKAND